MFSLSQISCHISEALNSKTVAIECLTPYAFKKEYVFNSLCKNATHKSNENKKEMRWNTQSASRRASGILRSCEMCKCVSTENVLINISHRRLPEETLPPPCATYNSPHIFAPLGISISHYGAFLIDIEKRRNEKIDRKKECVKSMKRG